jgi:hypothetical protein
LANVKRKLITYLLILAVALLFLNIIIDIFSKKSVKTDSRELAKSEIENTFWQVLDNYGIKAEWVSKKRFKMTNEDSINAQFNVSVPGDIPIPLIIKDINNVVEKDITAFVSEEKKIFGTTEIRIYTNEILKLKATLIPDPNLIRKRNEFTFVISNGMELNDKRFAEFLQINFPIASSVVPDPDMIMKADSLSKFSKDYILLLSDDLSESKMKLVQEYQKELLRSSVKNILTSFQNAKAVIVDEKSKLYNSPIYNFVRDEIKRRNYAVCPLSEFIKLESDDSGELFSKFKFYAEDTVASKSKIFYMPMENFEKVLPMIEKYKKQGSKILPISKSYLLRK